MLTEGTPQDAVYENSDSFKKKCISSDTFYTLFQRIRALKTLILIDACFSSKLAKNDFDLLPARSALEEKTALDRLMRSTGRTVLSATSNMQYALEGYKKHGVFTYAILQGLRGLADSDSNGIITTNELGAYVRNEVPKISTKKWSYSQIPMYQAKGDSFPIGCTEANEGCKNQ